MNRIYIIEKDGDSWCAHDDKFVNLQESPCAFGNNPLRALASFICLLLERAELEIAIHDDIKLSSAKPKVNY